MRVWHVDIVLKLEIGGPSVEPKEEDVMPHVASMIDKGKLKAAGYQAILYGEQSAYLAQRRGSETRCGLTLKYDEEKEKDES